MTKEKMTPWERFMGLVILEKKDILQIFYFAIFSGVVTLSLPLGIQSIINLIQGAQVSTSWIVLVVLVTLGVIFAGGLQLMQFRIIETIQQRIFIRASFDLIYRFPKIKLSELSKYYPPEMANRFFDTLTIQKGLTKILIDLPTAVLQIVLALLLLSFYHPFFIIFGILLLLLIFVVFKYTAKKGLDTSLEESKNKYKVAHWIQEVARSNVSFKLSGNTSLALDKNDVLVSKYLKSREKHFEVLMIQFIQMISFKVLVTAGLLLIGGALVLHQEMNIGQFVAAEIIILMVIASVEKLMLGLESLYDVVTSIEKIGQIADKELEDQMGEKPHFQNSTQISLENISYSVPNRKNMLSGISFTVKDKSRILIEGESGSGKSTLLKILTGVLEPTDGNIFLNELSLKSLKLSDYRSHLGTVLSEETPFEGSIRENLTFGNIHISDDEIYSALEKVKLTSFLRTLAKGLNTLIYPNDPRISSTTAKKIVLARAILKKPKLLVLENPLDHFNKEEAIQIIDYLTDRAHPWALVVVSTNSYWRKNFDEIITLVNGEIKK